jgi:hypothetical protein
MKSTMNLADWLGSVTFFDGAYNTRPASELMDVSFAVLVANVAPSDGPALLPEKERAPYFVPCLLQDAPLVGRTAEKAHAAGLPSTGKQRSASHVTESRLLIADIDGVTEVQIAEIEDNLRAYELTHLLYSTHSHGRADKPGMRVRVLMPVDKSLNPANYKKAAEGLNTVFLGDLADPSGFALHQQQGVWATTPERAHLAFRRVFKAGVAIADALVEAAPSLEASSKPNFMPRIVEVTFDRERVERALQWIDPNGYADWLNVAIWLKAAYGDVAFSLWLSWSETADASSKQQNDGRYSPQLVWDSLQPRITPGQGAAALFAHARGGAVKFTQAANRSGVWGEHERAALIYLHVFHKRLYDEMFVRRAA